MEFGNTIGSNAGQRYAQYRATKGAITIYYMKTYKKKELPREGAAGRTHISRGESVPTAESLSLRTIPVWLKANGKKVKVNVILDDASNESFLNEQVAGVLGLQEPYQTVKVHVLNNEVETFQSMPVNIMIESVDGQYSKDICVKTCPQNVTGTYKVDYWSQSKSNWPHLQRCDFAKPAKDGLVDLLIGVDNADLFEGRCTWRTRKPNCKTRTIRMELYWIDRKAT